MSPIAIAWRNLRTRAVQTALTTLIIAFGAGLALAVVVLGAGLRRGLTGAGGPFELVVGPKGSATQLVVSSVLLQDVPIGNITYATYTALRADPRVAEAVPIALGDNVHGARIVGTVPELFAVAVSPGRGPYYRLAEGRVFADDFEAVLGSQAARQLGQGAGGSFISSHGADGGPNETEHAGRPYRVVGVLVPTGTPADMGVYVSLSSYWKLHESGEASIFAAGSPPPDLGVTAVLVRGRSVSASYQLYQAINAGRDLQAALPGAVLVQFLDLLGQGERVLSLIGACTLVMAAVSMALALYGAAVARQRETAIMRALGASRGTVLAVALCEALLLSLLGLLAGLLLGHVAAWALGALIAQRSALVSPVVFDAAELPAAAGMLALGLLAGALPALRAYRLQPALVLAEG